MNPGNQSGSLVLGGYEPERGNRSFVVSNVFGIDKVHFDITNSENRLAMDLSMVFATRAANDSMEVQALLGATLEAAINTTDSFILFPPEICDRFVDLFNLTYDARTNLYLVDQSSRLIQEESTNITFVLGNSSHPGDEVRIVLPYSSFIFEAGTPWYDKPTAYFSIRPTEDDSGSTVILGRTFLQEA